MDRKKTQDGNILNPGPGVKIFTYVTERSFDAYMWQAIEAKSKAIKSIMRRAEEKNLLKDVYKGIKAQLIADGVPESEIAFIHDAKNQKQRLALYEKVNKGQIRVMVGSTGKMGAGVNVQERVAALHHIDAPWRPRDIEQREGRAIRQGNIVYGPQKDQDGNILNPGPGVKIFTYVTERSFDAYMWQAIEAKSQRPLSLSCAAQYHRAPSKMLIVLP